MFDIEMTATPTQQPEALRLANALDELDAQFACMGLCGDAAEELRRLHAENEALRAERARSGLVHRKAVQEAVREALHEAKKACENLPAPESCSGIEKSLWDVATMACSEAILARYKE